MADPSPIVCESRCAIRRPVGVVFDFVVTDFFDNYPRWSPQVETVTRITPGPLRIGTRGHQVRVDHGRRTESEFRVETLVPGHRVVFTGLDYPYRIAYTMQSCPAGTELHFRFELTQLTRMLRPFSGVIRRVVERTTAPVATDIRDLIETETAGAADHDLTKR